MKALYCSIMDLTAVRALARVVRSDEGGESLSSKAMSGIRWMTLGRAASEVSRFLRLFILARLLGPGDFGLAGVAIFVVGTIEMFTELGFSPALIRKGERAREYLDTAFWVQIGRGTIQTIAVYLAAPHFAGWMHAPEATSLVRIAGLWLMIRAFNSPGMIMLNGNLDFKKIFAVNVTEAAVGLLGSFAFAFGLRSAWAIVASLLVAQLGATIATYFVAPHRPRLRLHWEQVRELSSFGRWVTGSNALIFLSLEGDKFLMGRMFGPVSLGFYVVASKLAGIPRLISTEIISKVALPVFAKLQTDKAQLRATYNKIALSVATVAGLLACAIAIFCYPAILLVLGKKWTAIVMFAIFLPFGEAIHSVTVLGGEMFYACNRPELRFYMNLLRLGVLVGTAFPLAWKFGPVGLAIASLLSHVLTLPFYQWAVQSATTDRPGLAMAAGQAQ